MSAPSDPATVIATRVGRVGRLLLNRPRALNALDLEMIQSLTAALEGWRDDPAIHAVIIEGAGGRAFCAGGDIRAIRDRALAGEHAAVERFFADEYALNALIAAYPKPYIALIDGICMGGGIGVSVHGAYRVTTQAGMFAMPETAIAMFPDIGATYLLPRLPGELGMYLGLTGTRLHGADAVHAGLATHFVPTDRFESFREDLVTGGIAALARHAAPLPPFKLEPHRAAIDRCFGADSIIELLRLLEAEGEWGAQTIATLRTMSPSAVVWSFAMIRRGMRHTLRDCLLAELKLTRKVTMHPDFAEGVRAAVVDKDRQPKWNPASLEEVDAAAIAEMVA
jgi:enoyl-CoA hydratase